MLRLPLYRCAWVCLAAAAAALLLNRLTWAADDKPAKKQPAAEASSFEPVEPATPEGIRRLLEDRNYAEAAKAIERAADEKDADRAWLAYLKARALYLAGQYDDAIAAYEHAEKDFGDSRWLRRYQFGRALALARKGDFQAAEEIYRQQATDLLSIDRKQEIADIYLQFADAYFKPADEHQPPDYAKALEFYNQALEVGPKPQRRIEVELRVARCYQALKNLPEAAKRFAQFSKDHPDSPLDIEARYRLGEVQLAQNQREEARRTWQDLLAAYENDRSPRVAEAMFNLSQTYGLPGPETDEALDRGVTSLEAFIKRFADHKLTGQAFLRIAQSYLHRGRYEDVVRALTRFLEDKRYADREETPDARVLLGKAYLLQKKFDEALAAWREYLAKHPAHSSWSEVQRQIVDAEFLLGAEARQAKRYDDARRLWQAFAVKYPLDPRNPRILLELGSMEFQQEHWNEAIAEWRRLVSKYPGGEESSQAQFLIAATLEEKLARFDEALVEYRKVTWGSFAGQAQARVARLTAKELTIATERVFRTDETPQIKLTSRNLESVQVRAYAIDLETYFRKMHLAGGVEALDVALIDPDSTIDFEVPRYAQYQQLESTIELPLPDSRLSLRESSERRAGNHDADDAENRGADGDKASFRGAKADNRNFRGAKDDNGGVMIVTVSSKTLEATTLVVQSDLDIVVKSSRDEVFVFAENMRTGQPWSKARLLISNGQQVFAEGQTDDDGVFRQTFEELKSAGDVRVFAVAEGNVASNVVGLKGVGVATGLTERGYIFTDRPAYRAGQLVHVRGIVRTVADDRFVIEAGKKYHLEVFDSRNRLIRQDEVELGRFGSFHTNFVLPPTSALGDYRIQVSDDDAYSYQGSFQVHEYRLDPVRLAVDVDRKVFYRGEEISGKITARYYYGAPVADREIRYQLASGRVFDGKTDENGELAFALPTRDFRESQVLPLVVTLPERNLQATVNFYLAVQGFSIDVNTVRQVFVSGETFEATITTLDAEGKPTGQKLALHVLERTTVEGKVGEREVEVHEVTTDDQDGKARVTLRLEAGGKYVLRAEGIDRFQNPVSGARLIKISDESDSVRLRILADKHTYRVGDVARLQLHWREKPALALVTYQGARVLDYKLVRLKTGDNELEVTMTATLAPNFELAAAVMTDERPPKDPEEAKKFRRFHQASSPFAVERELKLTIAAARKDGEPARPGDDVEVTITAVDPQGKPVEAELSLAMIEQSLWEMFGANVPAIQDFFRGQPRASALRTTSSVSFAYHPATRNIDPLLLAEKDRREIEAEEQRAREELRRALAGRQVTTGLAPTPGYGGIGGAGGAGRGEAAAADKDLKKLVDDLTATVTAESWDEVGAPGRVNAVSEELRLVISNEAFLEPASEFDVDNDLDGHFAMGVARDPIKNSDRRVRGIQLFGEPAKGSVSGIFRTETTPQPTGALVTNFFAEDGSGAGQLGDFVAPSADELLRWKLNANGSVAMLGRDGSQVNLALNGEIDEKQAGALAAKLAEAGAVLLPPTGSQETAYWNPAIVTDAKGKASVTITLPDRATAWKLLAKGVTAETLAGEGESELAVKKDLFGELKLPLAFTEGDEAEIEATVHNDAVEKGPIEITLRTTIGGKTVEETRTLEAGKGMHELRFKTKLERGNRNPPLPPEAGRGEGKENAEPKNARPHPNPFPEGEGTVLVELTVKTGERTDTVRRSLPLQPFGMPVYATAGGSASSDTTVWVEPPKDMTLANPQLEIIVGPNVEQSLLDVLLAPTPLCGIDALRLASGTDTTTSDLMAAVALENLIGGTRQAGTPQAEALDARVRSSLSVLVSSQNDDGGWSWTGKTGTSNRYVSARVVWSLSLAKAAGYRVADDVLEKAIGYLNGLVAATGETDFETKAILLHALAAAGRGDFALANRLYRNRPSLSAAALAYLALALAEMDRQPMAKELLDLLAKQSLDESRLSLRASSAKAASTSRGLLPWSEASTEIRALHLLGLEKVSPQAAKTKELVDWLMAHRHAHRWSPDKATGPATLALADWYGRTKFDEEHYKLTVIVNNIEIGVLDVTPDSRTQTLAVPPQVLKKDKQRVQFSLAGRGRYTFQCVLGGFVPADKLKSTTNDWRVRRYYEPAPRELDGEPIPRGFEVLQGNFTPFRNPLTELPVGQRGHVTLQVWRQNLPANTHEEHLEYLVITEPLPSGVTVIEQSVTGGFERFELRPGEITFYVGSRQAIQLIHYDVHGYLPGSYRAGPTAVRNAYRPEQLAVAEPKSLAVLPLGRASGDEYRWSPQELFELGKRHFAKHELAEAGVFLTELVTQWQLRPEIHREAASMLLDIHLARGPEADIVRYFELIKEKWPDVELTFEKIVKVGAAYDKLGEYERAYLIFRATVESSFLRENGVAGFLEEQGEFLRSVEVMGRLLAEYPPEGYAAAAQYALAQQVYAYAPQAAGDTKLRDKKVTRIDLIENARRMLDSFLTAYPEDPAADQASFSLANALLELKTYRQAIAQCERYAERYPNSDYLDSYWYIIGYSHFALGEHEAALAMCRKVAEAKRVDRQTGREEESNNKWRAIYILAQVYHSLGKAAEAIREYTLVADRFADAKQAIAYFAHKEIALPEVTTFQPNEQAHIELKFRNVARCDARVYKIDLMKFSLLKRNLSGITGINLAGIRPYHEATIELGDGKDYRDRTRTLELPLKDEGAYLVVCRGDDLHASGLVLVTPLAVEVQEEASSGEVRATVKNVVDDGYVPEVQVKVIGTRNGEFVSGETDLRGVFVAQSIQGTATVIAEGDNNRYAFFRGHTELGPPPAQANQPAATPPAAAAEKPASDAEQLLEGLQQSNRVIQRLQDENRRGIYRQERKGVKAKEAF
ncbi:MAG TPA: tetratricopeptide repeat protein [Pirellulales bacterium]